MQTTKAARTTADLIRELETEARSFQKSVQTAGAEAMVALAVWFEDHNELVFDSDEQKLKKLNEIIGRGGNPIGLVAVIFREKDAQFYSRPLDEYAAEAEAKQYLEKLVETTGHLLKVRLSPAPGWIN